MPWTLLLPEKDPKCPRTWLHILDEASEGKSGRRESERRMEERKQRIKVKPEAEEKRQRQHFCTGNQNRKEERVGPGELAREPSQKGRGSQKAPAPRGPDEMALPNLGVSGLCGAGTCKNQTGGLL